MRTRLDVTLYVYCLFCITHTHTHTHTRARATELAHYCGPYTSQVVNRQFVDEKACVEFQAFQNWL